MTSVPTKPFDAVQMIRLVRDEVSATIASMSVEQKNHWLRATTFSDPVLRRLMELAAEQESGRDA